MPLRERNRYLVVGLLTAAGLASSAGAGMISFGRDLNKTADPNNTPIPQSERTNANEARHRFLNVVPDPQFESFETSEVDGDPGPFLSTQHGVTATFSGAQARFQPEGTAGPVLPEGPFSTPTAQGRYGAQGAWYLELEPGEALTITFDRPIRAFGFAGIDVNDVQNVLEVNFDVSLPEFGGTDAFRITDLTGAETGDDLEGNFIYWSIVSDTPFQQVELINLTRPPNSDVFALDSFTFSETIIPTPGSIACMGVAGGLASLRRRRR